MPRSINPRRGFSLVELITAMAVSGVLVGAMGVVLVMASSAMERGDGPIDDDRHAASALADLQADIAEATRFFERKANSVWFEVPDRDNDGVAEHIRYAWSGTKGDPLTRSTNGGATGVVAADVRALDLTYILRPGLAQAISAEKLIADFTTHPGATAATGTVNGTNWIAQVLRPSFSADAVSWKATKLRLRLKQSSAADAIVRVSLVAVGADNVPGSTTYATADLKESLMSAALRTEEFTFAACDPIRTGQAVAIVIRGVSGTAAPCDVGHLVSLTPTMPFNLWRATSTTSGSSWTGYGQTQNTIFELYGTVTTESR